FKAEDGIGSWSVTGVQTCALPICPFDADVAAREELRSDGFARRDIRIERALDMRYAGQGYEIAVACPAEPFRAADLNELRITFRSEERRVGKGGKSRWSRGRERDD